MGESDRVIASNSAPIKQCHGAGDTLGHTQWFTHCGFGSVHLATFQGQEMEVVLNAANAAAVIIECVVQFILRSFCSVTCMHRNIHMKTETTVKLLHVSGDIQRMRGSSQWL